MICGKIYFNIDILDHLGGSIVATSVLIVEKKYLYRINGARRLEVYLILFYEKSRVE